MEKLAVQYLFIRNKNYNLKYWPYILLLLANLIYGLNYSIAKDVMPHFIPPMGFVLMRSLAAFSFFMCLPLFIPKKNKKPIERKDFPILAACGFFGVCLNQLSFFKGLELTAPISASVIMTLVPILVLILSYFILSNPITWLKAIGVFLGMLGALIIIFSHVSPYKNASNPVLGNILVLLNASSYSLYLILAKPLLAKYHPLIVLKWLFIFGLIMVLPFGYQDLIAVDWSQLPTHIWYAIGFVLIFVSCLTYLFNLSALRKVNPSTVSIFIYSQPVFAILYSLWLKNDILDFPKIIGTFFIFLGVYFVISNQKNKQRK